MPTPRLRAWFTRITSTNSRGKQFAFKNGDEPNQNEFEDLFESTVFKTEAGDRAKPTTGGALENEVGHVSVHTDVEAKAGTSGLKADRTNATHAGQLPTTDSTESQTVGALSDVLLEVVVDPAVLTRNSYLLRLRDSFRAWLDTLRGDVDTNTTNIATNASDISNIQTNGILDVTDDSTTVAPTRTLRFDPAEFTVTDDGGDQATVNALGGTGITTTDDTTTVNPTTTLRVNPQDLSIADDGGGQSTLSLAILQGAINLDNTNGDPVVVDINNNTTALPNTIKGTDLPTFNAYLVGDMVSVEFEIVYHHTDMATVGAPESLGIVLDYTNGFSIGADPRSFRRVLGPNKFVHFNSYQALPNVGAPQIYGGTAVLAAKTGAPTVTFIKIVPDGGVFGGTFAGNPGETINIKGSVMFRVEEV